MTQPWQYLQSLQIWMNFFLPKRQPEINSFLFYKHIFKEKLPIKIIQNQDFIWRTKNWGSDKLRKYSYLKSPWENDTILRVNSHSLSLLLSLFFPPSQSLSWSLSLSLSLRKLEPSTLFKWIKNKSKGKFDLGQEQSNKNLHRNNSIQKIFLMD